MSDLLLDMKKLSSTFGDLAIMNGDLALTPDQRTGIQQDILQRLRVYSGEWFMDTSIGIDYFGLVLTKNPDQGSIDALLISTILGVPGVVELLNYAASPNFVTRQLAVSFAVSTTQGTVSYEGIL